MAFDDAAVDDLFSRIVSHALRLGRFESVNQHEPKNKPGNGLRAAVWVESIEPVTSSGLASVSGRVTFSFRIYQNFKSEPEEAIDPDVLKACNDLMREYSGDFDLGTTVRHIDIFGSAGFGLSARAGYLDIDRSLYRVMTLTIPIIINDLWTEAG